MVVARTPQDRPIFNGVAVMRLDDSGRCQDARVAMGGLAKTPLLLPELAASLEGTVPSRESLSTAASSAILPDQMPDDVRASATYRRQIAPVLLRRLLIAAWRRAADGTRS